MTAIPEKYLVTPYNLEVDDNDTVLRRIHKRQQITEEGKVKLTAFLLRKKLEKTGLPENQISVVVEKIGIPEIIDKRFTYCRISTSEIRNSLVGVWHNPTDHPTYKNAHGSLCGYFDEQKALTLSELAKVIE